MLDWLLGFVGGLLYPLFSIIFVCLDGLQAVFYALAGVGNVSFGAANNNLGDNWGAGTPITNGNSGADNDTGLIYYLFQNNTVKNLLISIMILALFLVIIFTVMAFIKNAYAAKQKGWKEIVGNSIKGLANFILLPVFCLLGVWLANILLQAINGATSGGGGTQMSRKLFIAAAYNANEFRNDNPDISDENIKKLQDWADGRYYLNSNDTYKGSSIKTGQTAEYYAKIVDDIYASTEVSISGYASVETWYSLWEINYLVLVVGGVFMLQALGSIAYSMIKRMFMLVILFVVSPGVCALYPLDEGKAVQSWSGEVKKNILSAHGSVAAINIFFALMPLIDNLHFFGGVGSVASLDDLFQLFILTVGLMCVGEFTGLLSGFIGGNDAYSSGKGAISKAAGTIGKTAVGAAVVGGFIKDHGSKVAKGAWGTAKAGTSALGARFQAGRDVRKQHKQDALAEKEAKLSEKLNPMSAKHAAEMTPEGRAEWEKEHQQAVNYFAKKERKAKKQEQKEEKRLDKMTRKGADEAYGKGGYSIDERGMILPNEQGNKFAEEATKKRQATRDAAKAKAKSAAEKRANVERGKQIKRDEMNAALEAHGYSKKAEETKKQGGSLWGALKDTAKGIYEETGGKDKLEKITKNFKKSKNAQEEREEKDKKGPGGINKSLANLAQFLDLNESVKIEAMGSDVIKAIGQTFGEEVAKRMFKGELKKEDGTAFDASDLAKLGLSKFDSMDDFNNLDSIMKKLLSYERRIQKAEADGNDDVRDELIKEAIDFAKSADAGSNEKLQDALDSAIASLKAAQKGQPMKLDDNSVKALANASNEAAKAMIREMKTNTKSLIDAFFKSQKKDK